MAIAYSGKAESDLLDILEYGHTAWPGTADDFMAQLQQRIESTLTSHPNAGRKGREQGTPWWGRYNRSASLAIKSMRSCRIATINAGARSPGKQNK